MPVLQDFWLTREKTLRFIADLAAADISGTLYLPAGLTLSEGERVIKDSFPGHDIPAEVLEQAARSPTGAVIFGKLAGGWLLLPPLPLPERGFTAGLSAGPLHSLLLSEARIVLVLVRLGAYAIGLCRGEELIYQKAGTGLVHQRHRQGGSSAARFRRHREKQIEYFLTRVCEHIREGLAPEARSVDYLVYGGAWTTLLLLEKRCPMLGRLAAPRLTPLLDIARPSRAELARAVTRVWSSRVLKWVSL